MKASFRDGQLQKYGNCLQGYDEHAALILLTGGTEPPEDFLSEEGRPYGVALTSVCTWAQIHNWTQRSRMPALVSEFGRFLETQGFDDMNQDELAVLNQLFSKKRLYGKLTDLMGQIDQQIRKKLKPRKDIETIEKWYTDKSGALYESVSLRKLRGTGDVEWGFASGSNDDYFRGLKLPRELHAYVLVERVTAMNVSKAYLKDWVRLNTLRVTGHVGSLREDCRRWQRLLRSLLHCLVGYESGLLKG